MAWLRRLAVLLVSLLTAVRGETAPVLELVLARFNENLDWIGEIDACWNITVYNKGNNATLPKIRPYTSVDVPNTPGGRESETFLRHIIYRYDSLADYTVFSQGGPFVHSPHFLNLMRQPEAFREVQALSRQYTSNDRPGLIGQDVEQHVERMSLYTLGSQYVYDEGTRNFYRGYMQHFRLQPGTKLMAHFFEHVVGLPDWLPPGAEVGSFSFGGIFGATRDRLRQHPQALWQTILSRCTENNAMGYFIERSWLMLLDPGFAACDSPEPRLEVFRNLNTSALECQPAGASRLQRLSLHLQAAANRHLLRG